MIAREVCDYDFPYKTPQSVMLDNALWKIPSVGDAWWGILSCISIQLLCKCNAVSKIVQNTWQQDSAPQNSIMHPQCALEQVQTLKSLTVISHNNIWMLRLIWILCGSLLSENYVAMRGCPWSAALFRWEVSINDWTQGVPAEHCPVERSMLFTSPSVGFNFCFVVFNVLNVK